MTMSPTIVDSLSGYPFAFAEMLMFFLFDTWFSCTTLLNKHAMTKLFVISLLLIFNLKLLSRGLRPVLLLIMFYVAVILFYYLET